MYIEDKSFKRKIIALVIIGILLCFCIGLAVSYAFFTARVVGNSSQTAVTTGIMEVTYQDGNNNLTSLENMIPGQSFIKRFSVKNTGTVTAYYDIYINEVINTFLNEELKYSLVSQDGGSNISLTPVPNSNEKIAENVEIEVGQTHNYELTILFIETNENQDYNKGKRFSGKVELLESNKVMSTPMYAYVYQEKEKHYFVDEGYYENEEECQAQAQEYDEECHLYKSAGEEVDYYMPRSYDGVFTSLESCNSALNYLSTEGSNTWDYEGARCVLKENSYVLTAYINSLANLEQCEYHGEYNINYSGSYCQVNPSTGKYEMSLYWGIGDDYNACLRALNDNYDFYNNYRNSPAFCDLKDSFYTIEMNHIYDVAPYEVCNGLNGYFGSECVYYDTKELEDDYFYAIGSAYGDYKLAINSTGNTRDDVEVVKNYGDISDKKYCSDYDSGLRDYYQNQSMNNNIDNTLYNNIPKIKFLNSTVIDQNYPEWTYDYDISSVTIEDKVILNNASCLFSRLKNVKEFNNLDNLDLSNVESTYGMFLGSGTYVNYLDINFGNNFNVSNVKSMERMFSDVGGSSESSYLNINLGNSFNPSSAILLKDMFNSTGNHTSEVHINLGNNFDTTNVKDYDSMFAYAGEYSNTFDLNVGDKINISDDANYCSLMFYRTGYTSNYQVPNYLVPKLSICPDPTFE